MSIFSSVKIADASHDYSNIDLSSNHYTTTDFGCLSVLNCADMIIGDKCKYGYKNFTRVAPMVFPTLGVFGCRTISAFVPYYLIADDADSYISGLKNFGSERAVGRYLTASFLPVLFFGPINLETGDTESDFSTRIEADDAANLGLPTKFNKGEYVSPIYYRISSVKNSGYDYRKLNHKGKLLLKLLNSLGYQLPQDINFSNKSAENYYDTLYTAKLNAYPLLCFLKLYSDILTPTSYYQTSPILNYLQKVKCKDSSVVGAYGDLSFNILIEIIKRGFPVFYDSDYFTSAWQTPNSPLAGNATTTTTGVSSRYGAVHTTENDNITSLDVTGSGSQTAALGATQLNFLRAFDSFVRRNNLVGFREFNAVYSRFGIKPSEYKSNYCHIIDIRNLDLNVGDVTATSSSEGEVLGSYAGKGFINGGNGFEFKCDDYGFFIQVCYLYVKPTYFQGVRKHCLRTNYLDFYQPEFDGVGPDPISQSELNYQSNSPSGVFGFTERYNDYRYQLDNITGDFVFDEQMSPWHTGRYFDRTPYQAQADSMICYVNDSKGNNPYDRIFASQNVDNPFDHFYQVWHFDFHVQRKMKNINEALNLGQGNITLDKNGAV